MDPVIPEKKKKKTFWQRRRQAMKEKKKAQRNLPNGNSNEVKTPKISFQHNSLPSPIPPPPPPNLRKEDSPLYREDADVEVTGTKPKTRCVNWNDMDFDKQLLKNIKECQYIWPRKVQAAVLPYLVDGYDIQCQSETGTGKTASYLIPLIDNLIMERKTPRGLSKNGPYCLIIAPTREFVQQIYMDAKKLIKDTGITIAVTYGGIGVKKNLKRVAEGCNILCTCLGSLSSLMDHDYDEWDNLDMTYLKYIVIDEADHFLKGNQKTDLLRFYEHKFLPKKVARQTCFFSPTLQPRDLDELTKPYINMKKRVLITSILESNQRVKYEVDLIPSETAKFLCLSKRISDISAANGGNTPRIMIFVNRIGVADTLKTDLTLAGFPAVVMHSDYSQAAREKAFYKFKNGVENARILVSVNACGRGIDIPDMDYVINYNFPDFKETFIQRCGRTGRTKNGTAITFYVPSDPTNGDCARWMREIIQRAGQEVPAFLQSRTSGIEAAMNELVF